MNKVKLELTSEEVAALLQCILNLNFSGKDIILIGVLANKLQQELTKLQTKEENTNEKK